MALDANKPGFRPAQVPVIRFNEKAAERAFGEHRALAMVEAMHPQLRSDPNFQHARQAAYRRFERAFEVA